VVRRSLKGERGKREVTVKSREVGCWEEGGREVLEQTLENDEKGDKNGYATAVEKEGLLSFEHRGRKRRKNILYTRWLGVSTKKEVCLVSRGKRGGESVFYSFATGKGKRGAS